MQKLFDEWNGLKKKIENISSEGLLCHKGDVWWASVGVNIGVESDGKGATFGRPVFVVQVFNRDMVWVLPITSTPKTSPFYHQFEFNGTQQSIALSQIRTISTKRLNRYIGAVPDEEFNLVLSKLGTFLKTKPLREEGNLGRPKP